MLNGVDVINRIKKIEISKSKIFEEEHSIFHKESYSFFN